MGENLILPKNCRVDDLELTIENFFTDHKFENPLIIDFTEVAFIEIASLLFLVSFICNRNKERLPTKIQLPISNNVLMILHTWRFFEIIEELTENHISYYLTEPYKVVNESKIKIGNKYFYHIFKDYYKKNYSSDQGINSLLEKGFFSLYTLPFDTFNEKSKALKDVTSDWKIDSGNLIVSTLRTKLDSVIVDDNLFSNTIVYEAVLNAARHPKSNKLVMGSYFDTKQQSKSDKGSHFSIFIWDNGISIVDTLKDVLIKDGVVLSEYAKKFGYNINFVKQLSSFDSTTEELIKSNFLPSKNSLDEDILISAFLPGISRDPEGKDNGFNTVFHPGMGLTILLDYIVKRLKGSIRVRTKDLSLKLSNTPKGLYNKKDGDLFLAKVKKYSKSPFFLGNMITLRIHLNNYD